jgi:hypothetical protein
MEPGEGDTPLRPALTPKEALCADVELTLDRTRHVELLGRALDRASKAMSALASVQPTEDPNGWLGGVGGPEAEAHIRRAKDLREHEDRFAEFLDVVRHQLSASGTGILDIERIVGDGVAHVSPEPASALVGLGDAIRTAASSLGRASEDLRADGSSVVAWNRVRCAQDMLEGSLVVMASKAVGEAISPSYLVQLPAAYLCAVIGATLVEQGFAKLTEADEQEPWVGR